MKRILSIDGGGLKGLTVARWLDTQDYKGSDFDLIAGTSTGGLLALGLAAGLSPAEMADFYLTRGPEIFRKRFPRKLWVLFRERYSAKPLESALRDVFGDTDLRDLGPEVLIPSADFNAPSRQNALYMFHKRRPWSVFDAARATSAAPTYFPPHFLGDMVLIDGGTIANNPATCAFAEARKLWPNESIDLLSVGTGMEPGFHRKVSRRPWKWIDDIIQIGIAGNVGKTDTVAHNIATGSNMLRYRRVDFPLSEEIAMDDTRPETLAKLEAAAGRAVTETVRMKTGA